MTAAIVARLRAAGCVFAEDEARLLVAATVESGGLEALVARRVAGEPLEHVLGWASFAGLRLAVAPGVFVPRRRTEFLVERAIGVARPAAVVVDLCCGTGALGAAVQAAVPSVRLYAADLDPAAVECARRNVRGEVFCGDLFDALPVALRGRIDVLLANVPYVPSDAVALMPPEAREHEALLALDGGTDGLDLLRRLAPETQSWLAPGGFVFTEAGREQAPAAGAVFEAAGLSAHIERDDDATIVVAVRA